MSAYWALQRYKGSNHCKLIEAANKNGLRILDIDILDEALWFPTEDLKDDILHIRGTIEWTLRLLNSKRPFKRNIFLTPKLYLVSNYYDRLASVLLNSSCRFTKFKTHLRHPERIWDLFSKYSYEAKIFIRPDSGLKEFTGFLLDLQDVGDINDPFRKVMDERGIREDIKIVISKPQPIVGEWRFVCSHSKVYAVSSYRWQGLDTYVNGAPRGARDLCNHCLTLNLEFDDLFVIDICLLESGGFKVVEVNPFSSAGIYNCDSDKVVEAMMDFTEEC